MGVQPLPIVHMNYSGFFQSFDPRGQFFANRLCSADLTDAWANSGSKILLA